RPRGGGRWVRGPARRCCGRWSAARPEVRDRDCGRDRPVAPWVPRRPTMFEEAQLYSPVTTGEDGTVTVHLSADHPGRDDPAYRERRNAIAAQALTWTPGNPPPVIDYAEAEQEVWRTVQRELAIKHQTYACRAFREAAARLDLPQDRIPQLTEVTAALGPLTGFRYVPA